MVPKNMNILVFLRGIANIVLILFLRDILLLSFQKKYITKLYIVQHISIKKK